MALLAIGCRTQPQCILDVTKLLKTSMFIEGETVRDDQPEHYHPIDLGETFNQRYAVAKLKFRSMQIMVGKPMHIPYPNLDRIRRVLLTPIEPTLHLPDSTPNGYKL
jgi:hypothetical protein